jgi:hypothetical protein
MSRQANYIKFEHLSQIYKLETQATFVGDNLLSKIAMTNRDKSLSCTVTLLLY